GVVLPQAAERDFFLRNGSAFARLGSLQEVEMETAWSGLNCKSFEGLSCFFFVSFDHSRFICLEKQHAIRLRYACTIRVWCFSIPGQDLVDVSRRERLPCPIKGYLTSRLQTNYWHFH